MMAKRRLANGKQIELKNQSIENIKVYPNPAVYNFNLVLTTDKQRAATMEIFALNGQSVYSQTLKIQQGFNKFPVDVTAIPKGQYIIKLSGEGIEIAPMKILIQRA